MPRPVTGHQRSRLPPGRSKQRPYYGWVQVLTLSVTETISWGILYYGFAVFLVPMEEDPALGWSRAEMTGAFSLALLVAGITAVPAGRWLDRHGPRLLMTAGSVAASLLLLAWATVDSLPLFYLIWAGIGVSMAAVLYEPAFAVIATWFRRKRSRALTLLTFVGGFASVIFIPLASWLIRTEGWRTALVVLAVILALGTILPHALILRRHPEDLGLLPDGATRGAGSGERGTGAPAETQFSVLSPQSSLAERSVPLHNALHGSTFWWLTAAFFLALTSIVAVTIHLIPYLIEQGFDAAFAATAAGLVGLLAVPGRLIFTPLGSVLPRQALAAFIFLLVAISLVVLVQAESEGAVLLFVALFGAGFGAITPLRAALIADLYGPAAYGSISGVLALGTTGARALGPIGASALYAWWGGYTPVLWFLAALALGAAGTVLLASGHEESG